MRTRLSRAPLCSLRACNKTKHRNTPLPRSTGGDTPLDCQAVCCNDPKCATWVYVPAGLYPSRPPGTFCWLKAAAIPLRGSTCDNGKAGCVSGVVAGRGGGSSTGGGYQPDPLWHPTYTAGSNGSLPSAVSSCAVGGSAVYVGQRGAGVEPILVLDTQGKVTRGFGSGEVRLRHTHSADTLVVDCCRDRGGEAASCAFSCLYRGEVVQERPHVKTGQGLCCQTNIRRVLPK